MALPANFMQSPEISASSSASGFAKSESGDIMTGGFGGDFNFGSSSNTNLLVIGGLIIAGIILSNKFLK